MQNQYHINTNRNQFIHTHQFGSEYARLLRRFAQYGSIKELLYKAKAATVHCLATLTVGGLFLSGTYFFLVQLANYGW